MLFRESELTSAINTRSIFDEAYNLLSEAVYLTEDESFLSPVAVPVVENTRLGMPVVNFSDVERLSEENGIDYGCAVMAIAESNGLSDVCVAVSESEIIMNPDLCLEMDNIVISEMPDSHVVYQYTEACLDTWLESGDSGYLADFMLDSYLTEASAMNYRVHIPETDATLDYADALKFYKNADIFNSDEDRKKRLDAVRAAAKKWADKENEREAKSMSGARGGTTSYTGDKTSATIGTNRTTQGFTKEQIKAMEQDSKAESNRLKKNPAAKTADETNREQELKQQRAASRQNADDYLARKERVMRRRNASLAARAARDASGGGEESKVKESESYLNKIKQMCWNKPKKFIADKIAAIRKWAHNVQNSTESGIWMKIKKIVAKVITTLEGWLAKAPAQAEENTANEA